MNKILMILVGFVAFCGHFVSAQEAKITFSTQNDKTQEVVVMPPLSVQVGRIQPESKNWEIMQRRLELELEGKNGARSTGTVRIESSRSILPEFTESIVAIGRDAAKSRGLYEVKSGGEVQGTINFRAGVMYTPKVKSGEPSFSYGVKTVRRATGPAISIKF